MCMRKCGKDPLCFFSHVNGIRAETEEPIWSRAFSFGLIRLMSHPFFEFDGTDSLILILQFAVICRTDDRRPWKMPPLPEVDALKRLCSTMELCSGPLTSPISEIFTNDCTKESPPRYPKACLEAEIPYDRRLCERSSYYLQDPKHLVFLMLQIAKVVDDHPKPTAPHVTKERGFDVYSVTTVDLHNIRDALDTMELHYGEGSEAGEFTIPTNLILEKYLASSGIENDVPHGTEQSLDFIVRSTVRREREIFNAVTYRNQQ